MTTGVPETMNTEEPAGADPSYGPAGPSAAGTSRRRRLVQRFEAWLDEALDREDLPAGLESEFIKALDAGDAAAPEPVDPRCDLYSLWSAVTAVSQEVKLQGRTFRQLQDSLGPVTEAAPALGPALAARSASDADVRRAVDELRSLTQAREKEISRRSEEQAIARHLELLFDLRDRLLRGLSQTKPEGTGGRGAARGSDRWFQRIFGRAPRRPVTDAAQIAAFRRAYELVLERLEEALRDLGVREIPCEGRNFEPRTMRAVETVAGSGVAEGTVVEVRRRGYERHGEALRPAEVAVARGAGTDSGKGIAS